MTTNSEKSDCPRSGRPPFARVANDRKILSLDMTKPGQLLEQHPQKRISTGLADVGNRTWCIDDHHAISPLRALCPGVPDSTRDNCSDDKVAPLHSITLSARASRVGGTVSPSAFAVLRLMVSSYFVGACTGRSCGNSPFRIRST